MNTFQVLQRFWVFQQQSVWKSGMLVRNGFPAQGKRVMFSRLASPARRRAAESFYAHGLADDPSCFQHVCPVVVLEIQKNLHEGDERMAGVAQVGLQ